MWRTGVRAVTDCTEPASTTAEPGVAPFGLSRYGNRLLMVVGASGSCASRRSRQILRPSSAPNCAWKRASSSERRTSSPPPLPKTAPMSAVVASTSLRVHGAAGLPVDR